MTWRRRSSRDFAANVLRRPKTSSARKLVFGDVRPEMGTPVSVRVVCVICSFSEYKMRHTKRRRRPYKLFSILHRRKCRPAILFFSRVFHDRRAIRVGKSYCFRRTCAMHTRELYNILQPELCIHCNIVFIYYNINACVCVCVCVVPGGGRLGQKGRSADSEESSVRV